MVKKQKDRREFEGKPDHYNLDQQDKKSRNVINYLKPSREDEKEPESAGNNKDYVWWLI
ncbi:MAG: hypothetical protein O8C61_05265 [Candidatus Methanoperedens sp.]|nr:hypothetical protein [Candidatus Methanoperedens sp.]